MTVTQQYVMEHFDEICTRAEEGEEIVVDRPGHIGLAIVPQQRAVGGSPPEAVEALRQFMHARPPLEGVTVRELIEEGRRY